MSEEIIITQHNDEGELHGYCKWYWSNKPYYKGHYHNGDPIGCWEYYNQQGELIEKTYYII